MRRITIEFGIDAERGTGVNVIDEYGRETGPLTFGEALQQLTSMFILGDVPALQYPMQTPEEWASRRQRRIDARCANKEPS